MIRTRSVVTSAAGCVASLAASIVGCASDRAGSEHASAAIVDGAEAPLERPEVGRLGDCTGTLVAPNVVLSAAHCFDFESGVRDLGSFRVRVASGELRYAATEVVVYGTSTGESDLALVRLGDAVSKATATPARLAAARPPAGGVVTMWGYGCAERPPSAPPSSSGSVFTAGDASTKRRVDLELGAIKRHACPGDSGGPVFDGAVIVAVVSAYLDAPGDSGHGLDVLADPVARRDELTTQIRRWTP